MNPLRSKESLPPLDLPPEAIVVLCGLIARQTITVRQRRRLSILWRLCSRNLRRTAASLGCTFRTVRRWYERGLRLTEHLAQGPDRPSEGQLRAVLLTTVADAPRPGAPPT